MEKKKYVQVGCGNRGSYAYSIPMVKKYSDCAELCGVYDLNKKRAELISKSTETNIPVFDDFDTMLDTVNPDTVIVTCKDSDHDDYIIRSLKKGYNVISEKPLTTTFEKANAIKDALDKSDKELIVTFNLRFHPFFKRIKELVDSGVIGDILSVHFEWMLNTKHGADYYRRWHRNIENSGSLLVHKSTHHFDLINWYLEQDPVAVNAFGSKRFYGPTRKERSERCLSCPHKKTCEFYLDIENNKTFKEMYLDCEDADGYFRDKCVFSDEIDIWDSMSVNVEYSGGTIMSYSLTSHSPYEGINLSLNGTEGRMEIFRTFGNIVGYSETSTDSVKIYNRKGELISYVIPQKESEGHGGADDGLRDMLFRERTEDPLHQMADLKAGLMSIAIGMAAYTSINEKRRVEIKEYLKDI